MNFTQKSLLTITGKISVTVLSLISNVFLARYLGVKSVGQYQIIISAQVILITIMAMGFGNATIYFINSKKIEKSVIVSNLLKMFSLAAAVLLLAMVLLMKFLPGYFGELQLYAIIIYAIGSGSLLLYNVLMPILYVSLEVIRLQVLAMLSVFIFLVGIVVLYQWDLFDINTAIVLTAVGNIVTILVLLYFLKEHIDWKKKMDFRLLKEIFFYGIKLSVTNLVFLLSANVVVFLLKLLVANGFESVGLFSRAVAIANMFTILPISLGPLLYSKWSTIDKENLHIEVEKTLRILLFISLSCVVGIFIFGELILDILYGKAFLGAKIALRILSVSLLFSSTTIVFTNLFSSLGKPMVTLKVYLGSLLLTSLLALLLMPKYNINGAAIAVLGGLIYNAFVLLFYSKKEIGLRLNNIVCIKKEDVLWLKSSLIQRRNR